MEVVELEVAVREELGKNKVKQLKKAGLIPSVVYGNEVEPISITVNPRELSRIYKGHAGQHALIALKVTGGKKPQTINVISHDIDTDCISGELKHVDFLTIAADRPVTTSVKIKLIGTPKGVKMGGQLLQVLRSVNVSCLPGDIPDVIEIDVSDMGLGTVFKVRDIAANDKYTVVSYGSDPLAQVAIPRGGAADAGDEEEDGAVTEEA